jgi:hypothetical protein
MRVPAALRTHSSATQPPLVIAAAHVRLPCGFATLHSSALLELARLLPLRARLRLGRDVPRAARAVG